jgi:hypothetical protein
VVGSDYHVEVEASLGGISDTYVTYGAEDSLCVRLMVGQAVAGLSPDLPNSSWL